MTRIFTPYSIALQYLQFLKYGTFHFTHVGKALIMIKIYTTMCQFTWQGIHDKYNYQKPKGIALQYLQFLQNDTFHFTHFGEFHD